MIGMTTEVSSTEKRMTDRGPDYSPQYPAYASAEFELVTPEKAQHYLDTMHSNRSLSRLEVGIHEANLREGSWFPEISPAFMDGADSAWDAQHRFKAIVNTGIPAYMLLIRGVSPDAAEYIDTGRKRTYADMLRMGEVPDYKRQSVLTKYIALYENYGIEGIRNPARYPVTQEAKNAHLNSDAVMGAIHTGEAMYRAVHANPSWAAYAAWRTGQVKNGVWTADPFWQRVRSGEELKKGDPALALRNWFLNGQKRDRRPADKRLIELYAYASSWNKEITGQSYQRVNPVFEERGNGRRIFPAANVVDFLPPDAGTMTRSQLRTAYQALEAARANRKTTAAKEDTDES
jgi:hypothetical protein